MQQDLDYQLVVSSRAKRASLRVVPGEGLIVSIPAGYPRERVSGFVERHRDWICASLVEIENSTPDSFKQWPPRELQLPALDLTMQFHYCATDLLQSDTSVVLHRQIVSPIHDREAVVREIAICLKRLARNVLPYWLASHAHLHGFHYQRVSIRGQRTRWGSYSSTGTVSLNYKLLFLSRELVDYVLLHELAHTVHPNHSAQFWCLLCQLTANARSLDRELRVARMHVPPWLARIS